MTPRAQRVVLVAAVADNGVIGNGPDIPWSIPGEQAEFKALTMGHTLVMGRATFEAIGRPLPGRTTVVVTRDPTWHHDGVRVAHGVEEALEIAAGLPGDAMVVGGGQIYAAAIGRATDQVLSRVHLEPEGDVFYPAYDPAEWVEVDREVNEAYDRVFLTRVEVAATADPDELWPVYQQVWGDRTREAFDEMWAGHSARDGFTVATVRRGGAVVGLAWAYVGDRGQWWPDRICDLLPDIGRDWVGDHWEVVELGLLPAWRGVGLGRALLRAVTAGQHRRMLLETNNDPNSPARRLYDAEGWQVLADVSGTDNVLMGHVPV